jgi:pimeloyl-ACP methyl ester carboxylesterase
MRFELLVDGPRSGDPILLLHGFPTTARSWDAVAAELAAAGRRVYALNQRGYCDGARPREIEAYRMENLVGDALAAIDHTGAESLDVVGHDWGATVGWFLAAEHPERVRRLTAVSVPHPGAYGWAFANDEAQRGMTAYMYDFRRGEPAEERLLEDGARGFREFVGPHLPAPAADRYLEVLGTPEALAGALAWYRANGREIHGLGPTRVAATFIYGSGDEFVSEAAAERCSRHVDADYRFIRLDGVSHWIPERQPQVLTREILRT